jgi:transposase
MARKAQALNLSDAEVLELTSIIKKGTHKSRKITRARVLLAINSGKSYAEIRSELQIERNHFYRIKRRYLEGGLASALEELPRSGQPAKVNPRLEAQITSIACSASPEGTSQWTLSLINEKLVELSYIESISNESIRLVLKKANVNPGKKKCGALVP